MTAETSCFVGAGHICFTHRYWKEIPDEIFPYLLTVTAFILFFHHGDKFGIIYIFHGQSEKQQIAACVLVVLQQVSQRSPFVPHAN